MLLKSGGFVLTGTIKRGHSRLWQKKNPTKHNKILLGKIRKKKVCLLHSYIFCIIILNFNNDFHSSHEISSFFKSRNKNGNQKQNFQPFHKNFSLPKASCFHLINQSPGNRYKSCAYCGKKNPKFNYKKFLSWIDVIFNAVFFFTSRQCSYILYYFMFYTMTKVI